MPSTNPADYTYWRQELAKPDCNDRDTERRDLCGFWRIAGAETKPDYPAAIWKGDEGLVCQIGSKRVNEGTDDFWDFLGSSWLKCRAVSHDHYQSAMETGRWPDDDKPARKMDAAEAAGVEAGIGHNMPDDPHEALKLELDGEREQALDFLREPINTQEKADKAAAWAKKLGAISKKAEDLRKVEKQPHLDAGNAVDAKWNPLRDDAKGLSTDLKRHLDAWLREQARLEEERRRKAEADAAEAQRKADEAARLAEAEQARSSEDAETAKAEAEDAAAVAAQAAEDAKAKNTAAGRTGAKVSLRTFVSARITDYDKALLALKDHPEMKALVEQLANRAIRAGHELEGVERVEEKRAA